MTKYRIIKNGIQEYRVQYRYFFFWITLKEYYRGFYLACTFKSLDKAREAVMQAKENETRRKKQEEWVIVERNNYDV